MATATEIQFYANQVIGAAADVQRHSTDPAAKMDAANMIKAATMYRIQAPGLAMQATAPSIMGWLQAQYRRLRGVAQAAYDAKERESGGKMMSDDTRNLVIWGAGIAGVALLFMFTRKGD